MNQNNNPESESETATDAKQPLSEHIEEYAGHIKSRHGTVHWWLAIVYLILFCWAMYYGYTYWGGLGPGLDY